MFELMNNMNNNFLDSYNPFREMDALEHNMMRNFFGQPALAEFKTDVSDEGDHYLLESDLPGFDKKDIEVSLQDDMLTIKAERHSRLEDKDQQDKIIRMERSYGSYTRQFDVSGIDAENISAKYENGVLKLTLPKKQEVKPETRKLEIE